MRDQFYVQKVNAVQTTKELYLTGKFSEKSKFNEKFQVLFQLDQNDDYYFEQTAHILLDYLINDTVTKFTYSCEYPWLCNWIAIDFTTL